MVPLLDTDLHNGVQVVHFGTRHGKPVAVVISIEDFRELQAAEDDADLAAARDALTSSEPRIPHREVLARYGFTTDPAATDPPATDPPATD